MKRLCWRSSASSSAPSLSLGWLMLPRRLAVAARRDTLRNPRRPPGNVSRVACCLVYFSNSVAKAKGEEHNSPIVCVPGTVPGINLRLVNRASE